ncbi:MAG: hypothetical protein IJ509_02855 [Bacilli bacterium]|nr:hypothetical protein [Bacilli bacterium]
MLYPKVKKRTIKMNVNGVMVILNKIILGVMGIFQSREYFFLFIEKSFHF